jgi:hypothetical protein
MKQKQENLISNKQYFHPLSILHKLIYTHHFTFVGACNNNMNLCLGRLWVKDTNV